MEKGILRSNLFLNSRKGRGRGKEPVFLASPTRTGAMEEKRGSAIPFSTRRPRGEGRLHPVLAPLISRKEKGGRKKKIYGG